MQALESNQPEDTLVGKDKGKLVVEGGRKPKVGGSKVVMEADILGEGTHSADRERLVVAVSRWAIKLVEECMEGAAEDKVQSSELQVSVEGPLVLELT